MKIITLFMSGLVVGIIAIGAFGLVGSSHVPPPVVAGVDTAMYIDMLKGRAYGQRLRIEQLKKENSALTRQLAQFRSGSTISIASPP
jgi:hypothetical protein